MYCKKKRRKKIKKTRIFIPTNLDQLQVIYLQRAVRYVWVLFISNARGLGHLQNTWKNLLLRKQSICVPLPAVYPTISTTSIHPRWSKVFLISKERNEFLIYLI